MKIFILMITLVTSQFCFALDKAQVQGMLEQMKTAGVFSEADIKAAQEELNKMSDDDLKALEEKAKASASDPAVQEKLKQLQTAP